MTASRLRPDGRTIRRNRLAPAISSTALARLALSSALAFALAAPAARGAPVIDADFEDEDPCTAGWACQGSTTWIGPDAPSCTDSPDDPSCNPLDIQEGFVRITPDAGGNAGAIYFNELLTWDSFVIAAEVELTGGGGSPADGMAIVIAGSPSIPGAGHDGGGLGATGLGEFPTMVIEIDNYGNGGPDRDNNNHVGYEYSLTGFESSDQLPSDGFAIVPFPLNGSGRFLLEVRFEEGTVTCDLTNETAGFPTTTMFEYTIPDFEPFEGYIGFTASTGALSQNHIVHSIVVDAGGTGTCLKAPATVRRDLGTPQGGFVGDRPTFQPGDQIEVSLTLTSVRADLQSCTKPSELTIREVPPAGWAAADISDGGTFDAGSGAITWKLSGAALAAGKEVSYKVTAAGGAGDTASFSGTVTEPGSDRATDVRGESVILQDSLGSPFDPCGGIRLWNILGAYSRDGGANPGEHVLRRDYMTDGTTGEMDFEWRPGATIATILGGAAASKGIEGGTAGRNPGGVPTVFGWGDPDGRIITEDLFGSGLDDSMLYAQAYVINGTGADMQVNIGVSSDDSVQILLNGQEVWINNAARPGSESCSPQDVSPDGTRFTEPILLFDGENSLIVKVFEGGGEWNFAVRFQDAGGAPVTEGLDIQLEPGGGTIPEKRKFHRGDSNGDGVINITDGIFTLNFLFLGGPGPACAEAANANDDAAINITDGIYTLNYLFLGGPPPVSPGPADSPCGPDPAGSPSDLGCGSYQRC